MSLLSDGTFVVATYGHWLQGKKPFVMGVEHRLGEIDAMSEKTAEKWK